MTSILTIKKTKKVQRRENSIGTSLKGCIRDIMDRNHPIERVERIISQTAFTNKEDLIAHVTAGKSPHKERIAEIAERLWNSGKISQPKIDGKGDIIHDGTKLWIPLSEVQIHKPKLF